MPKIGSSLSSKIKTWISNYPELKSDGKSVFCASCEKSIGCERKSQIDAHCNSGKKQYFYLRIKHQFFIIIFSLPIHQNKLKLKKKQTDTTTNYRFF
jgi:hypothetical protein